jgi:putative integral membrane protein (TIGR02587 family)
MTAETSPAGGRHPDLDLLIGVARAFGGAVFFALPLLMTMEMWWLGFYMDRLRLALFVLAMIPLLIGLDHFSGFKETSSWLEDAVDGMIAYGTGTVASVIILAVFGVLRLSTPLDEAVGMVALQAVPASLGAVLAASQLGGRGGSQSARRDREVGYGTELMFMLAGGVFLAFNLAPTEEMVLIAFKMTPAHGAALMLLTVLLMHAFVYGVEFHGSPSAAGAAHWSLFLRFTLVGYALSLATSAYVLWTFGRFEGTGLELRVLEAVVLGFPAGLGAAGARLIV